MVHQLNTDSSRNGKRWVFSEASFKKINRALEELGKRLDAVLVIFADMNGYSISASGDTHNVNVDNLTALAAGTFSATAEMANLVREGGPFKFIYHEGEQHNIYLCTVEKDYLIIVVFHKKTALGMVRALTHHTVERLEGLVEDLKQEKQRATQFLDVEFRSLLGKELDKTFGI